MMATITSGNHLLSEGLIFEVWKKSFEGAEDVCVIEKIGLPLRKGGEEMLEWEKRRIGIARNG